MDWIQTLTIMFTMIASAFYIYREVQKDIKIQSDRTDRLYDMKLKELDDDISLKESRIQDCKEMGHMWTWFPKGKRLCLRCGIIDLVEEHRK